MRIRSVTAHGFGPFTTEQLDLAQHMTVIVGPNESGKSSWHAAIYAALCGMRRGPGLKREDRDFKQRHAPWDTEEWRVACVVDLPDGRTIELTQDLASGVRSSAREMTLGTDVTDEIVHDGAPDGSTWLGLERRAFLAVASIRQAHILSVTEDAGALQEHLQRAAATAGTDQTAAVALKRIEDFSDVQVGSERAPSRPLMQSTRRVESATEALTKARRDHEDWLERHDRLVELEFQASSARLLARTVDARRAQQHADRLDERVHEARSLAERHAEEPLSLRSSDQLGEQVATSLHDWHERPRPVPMDGATAREIKDRLESLPAITDGDREPDQSVRSAHQTFLTTRRLHEAHLHHEPPHQEATTTDVTESELLDLARELETPIPSVDPELHEAVERLRNEDPRVGTRRRRLAGVVSSIGSLAALATGIVLLSYGSTISGVAAIAAGALLGLSAGVLFLSQATVTSGNRALASAEARLMLAEQQTAAAHQRRQGATARAREAGLDPNPSGLRSIADSLRSAEHLTATRTAWESRKHELTHSLAEAAQALRLALAERGAAQNADADLNQLDAAVEQYEDECRRRREQAALASERPGLEQALEARRRAEERVADDEARIQRVAAGLRDAASAAGVVSAEDAASLPEHEIVTRLTAWQRARDATSDELDRAWQEWARLQALLNGSSLEEIEAAANRARKRAAELSDGIDEKLLVGPPNGEDPDTLRQVFEDADRLNQEVAAARQELKVRAEQVLSVPEAEERLASAQEDLDHVRSLREVLETTKQFLAAAQDRVHRNIAPILANKVGDRLARVTDGRYSEVTIHPETLSVQVRDTGGAWRNADLLSHGTAEQVYLLLRVAMAEILTAEGTSCPLLLDDSTVQSDPQRTRAILEVLHEVSAEHQVILFSQEDDVLDWAQERLGPNDRLHALAI